MARLYRAPLTERIRAHISESPTDCWEWQLWLDRFGYGRIHARGGAKLAHRVSYEAFVGPIPEGLVVDHLCRNPRCVNPAHLEAVTIRENAVRGAGFVARNVRVTHCPKGHPFDEANTYLRRGGKGRDCRACHNASTRAAYRARRDQSRSNQTEA